MIRIPPEATSAMRAATNAESASSTPEPMGPISEHTPHWREAHLEIDDVHKGEHSSSTAVIRFPASTDVRWYKAPKFQPGHQGFFMLRKHTSSNAPASKGQRRAAKKKASDATTSHFTALHPNDFQPYAQPGGVRRIIESANEDE